MEWSVNQVVANNLRRIRLARGMTQTEACDETRPFMPGGGWTPAVWSAAERSVSGKRIRKFDGDELAALAAGLGVSISAFFLPPHPNESSVETIRGESAELGWSTAEVMQLAIDVEDYSIDAVGGLALALGIERSDSSAALLATSAAQLRIKAVIDGLDHLRETVSQLQISSET